MASMAQWVWPAVRALRLWGPGGSTHACSSGSLDTRSYSMYHGDQVTHLQCGLDFGKILSSIAGRRTPLPFSAGVSSIFGSGGSSEKEKLFLQDIAELIQARACQRVVVMVGAGISTPSGIPDFRSPGTGFYSSFQHADVPYPEAIFELSFFLHNPRPFCTWAKEMYPGNYRPNIIHYFLRLLHDKGLLLRLYTQNIDGLERGSGWASLSVTEKGPPLGASQAQQLCSGACAPHTLQRQQHLVPLPVSGIPGSKLVEAHGSFASATCTVCRRASPMEDFWAAVMGDRVPSCAVCTGVVKPDVVFFGEALPQRFLLHVVDFPTADLLLILGTSLQVEPFASLSEAVRSSVPRVFMNQEAVGPLSWRPRSRDVLQLGDLVDSVERLVELLGWSEELKDLVQRETGKLSGQDR